MSLGKLDIIEQFHMMTLYVFLFLRVITVASESQVICLILHISIVFKAPQTASLIRRYFVSRNTSFLFVSL